MSAAPKSEVDHEDGPPKARVLFVDDEPNVLHAVRRSLRTDFDVVVAGGGREALQIIADQPAFAAVVCDCRMPEMDGIELLQRIAKAAPAAVRLMLTGNIDQETAVRAVNAGEVFRFLTKPCDIENLRRAVRDAVRQHELVVAEKELLEHTLQGSIGVLSDLLGIVKPEAFGRTARVRRKVKEIAAHLDGISAWELDTAALLSQIGCMNVDQAILDKVQSGKTLTDAEADAFAAHAKLGADLIARIPRLGRVADIVRYQNKHFDGNGLPCDGVKGTAIPLEARVLHAALIYDGFYSMGWADSSIMDLLKKTRMVDPAVVAALAKCASPDADNKTARLLANELTLGMVVLQDVKTDHGMMLLCRGNEITPAILEHLLKFHGLGLLSSHLLVERAGSKADDAPSARRATA